MKKLQRKKGFTLVELAIVLTIIGLLIGGILKGQALVTNAKVMSQMSQIQSIDAATTTFKDTYAALPGDLPAPSTRIPNCTAGWCANVGTTSGDGIIGNAANIFTIATPTAINAASPDATDPEVEAFFPQLAAAGLLSTVNAAATSPIAGQGYAAGKVGGVLMVASGNDGFIYVANMIAAGTVPAGAGLGTMQAAQAYEIDVKMDDGVPATGTVQALGGTTCSTAAAAGAYLSTVNTKDCGQLYRIQN